MFKQFILCLALIVCLQSVASTQPASTGNPTVYSTVQAKKYKIWFITRKPLVATSLDSLTGNTLYVTGKNGSLQAVSIELISKLSIAKKKRPILRGMAIGLLTGASAGAIFGLAAGGPSDSNNFVLEPEIAASAGATAGALFGIIAGTILGATSYRFTTYDFTSQSPAQRAVSLERILSGQ